MSKRKYHLVPGDYPSVVYKKGRMGRDLATRRYQRRTGRTTGLRFGPGYQRTTGFYGRYAPVGPGGELKFFDVTLDDAVIAATGTVTDSINKIAQGVTESQRVGRKCTIRSIGWRYIISLPEVTAAANPPGSDTIRLIMFLDKQCNGATATVTGILEGAQFQEFNNLANKGRFRTLVDEMVDINYLSGVGISASQDYAGVRVSGSFFKKCSIPIEFDSTTGAITEIRSNNIGVLLISGAGLPAFGSRIRLRFSDN